MYTWEVPGEVMAVSIQQDDGTFHKVSTLRWDEARRGLVDSSMPAGSPALLAWQPGGSFVMDLGGARVTWSPLPDRVIELRAEVDKGQGLQVHWVQQRVEATPANVKAAKDSFALMKRIAANMAEIQRQDAALKASPLWQQTLVNRANAEAERARKRASGSNGLQIFGAILQGLSQGMAQAMPEYADGPYDAYGPVGSFDRAAANMTATVDGIQRQAAAERAQQAGFQAPADAASTGHHAVAAPVQERGMAGGTTPSPTPYAALEGPGTGAWAGAGTTASSGQASTRDDPSTCVSPPVTSTHQCASLSGYKARVSNNCAAPVDMGRPLTGRFCVLLDWGHRQGEAGRDAGIRAQERPPAAGRCADARRLGSIGTLAGRVLPRTGLRRGACRHGRRALALRRRHRPEAAPRRRVRRRPVQALERQAGAAQRRAPAAGRHAERGGNGRHLRDQRRVLRVCRRIGCPLRAGAAGRRRSAAGHAGAAAPATITTGDCSWLLAFQGGSHCEPRRRAPCLPRPRNGSVAVGRGSFRSRLRAQWLRLHSRNCYCRLSLLFAVYWIITGAIERVQRIWRRVALRGRPSKEQPSQP
jgi:hypothetical protein